MKFHVFFVCIFILLLVGLVVVVAVEGTSHVPNQQQQQQEIQSPGAEGGVTTTTTSSSINITDNSNASAVFVAVVNLSQVATTAPAVVHTKFNAAVVGNNKENDDYNNNINNVEKQAKLLTGSSSSSSDHQVQAHVPAQPSQPSRYYYDNVVYNQQQPEEEGENHHFDDDNTPQQQQNEKHEYHLVEATTILSQHPFCKDDVKRICKRSDRDEGQKEENKIQHNFEVLDCFMSYEGEEDPPSVECQSVIYQYKMKLTKDERFETAAKEVCKDFITSHKVGEHCDKVDVQGGYLPCLMELASYVEEDNTLGENCYTFLNKMQRVIFSDYHLVHQFQDHCGADIVKFHCGFIFDEAEEEAETLKHHSQGRVIECLIQGHLPDLSKQCKHQILRVSELQADDYHLDRPLFFACRADRDRHCSQVRSGDGKVYKCLMEKQLEGVLEQECVEQLIRREQVMAEDMKADRTFFQACKNVLQETGCLPDADTSNDAIFTMSHTLTCLLDAEAESDKELEVTKECQQEVELFKGNLMDQYRITAGIVTGCSNEIRDHCKDLRKAGEKDGTIHCLMELAMPTRQLEKHQTANVISNECKAEVTNLLDETRPASSVLAIDGFLMDQCNQELHKYCAKNNQPLDCLMDEIRVGKIDQDSNCARHLLELEYFISRNYKHDMRLVKACKNSINNYNLDHHLKKDAQGAPSDGLVFAQLYKLVRHQLEGGKMEQGDIDKKCVVEVLRCVHERAVSIDLNPELEQACMKELTTTCKDAEHGEEIGCLEEHVEKIEESKDPEKPGCREYVEDYIRNQDADYQLDTILMKACEPSIHKHCSDVLAGVEEGEIDEGEIFECLLEHKFDEEMDPKCFAGIEHHQIINMQDFNFNHKFREACNPDFKKHCKHVKSKSEAVYCLSAVIRNDTLFDTDHRVSEKCRAQLKVEFLALEDTIQMDPEFAKKCKADIKKRCSEVKPHPNANSTDLYLYCIKAQDPEELAVPCAKHIFKITKLANAVAGASSMIFRQCKTEIKTFCRSYMDDPEKLLDCLDDNYEDASRKCQKALDEEEEEDNQDIRLNPALYTACKSDVYQFCQREMDRVHDVDESLHGAVINCLKLEHVKGQRSGLSESCSNTMHLLVVKVQTRDYKMDYVLTHQCKMEVKECSEDGKSEDQVINCLKKKLFDGELRDDLKCQAEVFRLITENRVVIQTDTELYGECKWDLRNSECKTVLAGSGRLMSCLLSIYEKGVITNKKCQELVKKRKELWEHAAKLSPPETLRDIWRQMSPGRSTPWYLITIIIVASLFVVGAIALIVRRQMSRKNHNGESYVPVRDREQYENL